MLLWWASFDIWQLTIGRSRSGQCCLLSLTRRGPRCRKYFQSAQFILNIHSYTIFILYCCIQSIDECTNMIKIIAIIKKKLQICSGVRGAAKVVKPAKTLFVKCILLTPLIQWFKRWDKTFCALYSFAPPISWHIVDYLNCIDLKGFSLD